MVRELPRLLVRSVSAFMKDDGLRLSAALAFYASFSPAPLLIVAIAIAGFFFGNDAVRFFRPWEAT